MQCGSAYIFLPPKLQEATLHHDDNSKKVDYQQ